MTCRRLLAFWREERAAVTPMVAALAVPLLGAAGFALDVGLYYVQNQQLQTATEAAALAAAVNPNDAYNRANGYLGKNGFPGLITPEDVELGRYCADKNITDPKARFIGPAASCPGTSPTNPRANAVRVTATKDSTRFLTGVLGDYNPIPRLTATATAARIDEAGIATTANLLGTDATKLVGGLLNSVNNLLGALLGNPLLNLDDQQVIAMMRHNVDAGIFFDRLAINSGRMSGSGRSNDQITYGELLKSDLGLKALLLSASEATSDDKTRDALERLSTLAQDKPVNMTALFGLGVWQNTPVGEADAKPGLRAGLNAYQLLTYAAQASRPAMVDLTTPVDLIIPGSVVKVSAIGSTPVSRPRFSFGPAGETMVSTSAVRIQLQVGLGNALDGLVPSLPVLISVADGTAAITKIDCSGSSGKGTAQQADDTRVTVKTTPGLIYAYIGNIQPNAMNSTMPYIDKDAVTAAPILNAKLLGIPIATASARAIAGPIEGNPSDVTFGPRGSNNPQIGTPASSQAAEVLGTPAIMANKVQLGDTIENLLGKLELKVSLNLPVICLLPICDLNLTTLTQTLNGILTPILRSLTDGLVGPVLDNLLAALGLELGNTRVWVTGARCGVPVLV